ncbi:MAG: protein TolQ [Deltaproteobacteria bacterium]|nr:protein TolQ [Deltaproteobacteria bacterium]
MPQSVIHVFVAQTGSVTEISFWQMITHSGPLVFSVLLLLVVASVASWAVIGYKAYLVRQAQLHSVSFLESFWQSKRLDEIFGESEKYQRSPIAQVFRAGYVELAKVKQRAQSKEEQGAEVATLDPSTNIERALRRATTSELTHLETLVPFLATVGSTSPFVGLFGTVIGIMKAFRDIGNVGSANLATVAPGIAEALIATAAGLAAAIPAVIAYNYFNSKIKVLASEMDNFSADFMNIVRRHFF